MADILFGFSCFVYVGLATNLLVWWNPPFKLEVRRTVMRVFSGQAYRDDGRGFDASLSLMMPFFDCCHFGIKSLLPFGSKQASDSSSASKRATMAKSKFTIALSFSPWLALSTCCIQVSRTRSKRGNIS